ncbi:malate dehydrogenase [bacterium]|nr:MAG: malate dehydrogenase [bacterium]
MNKKVTVIGAGNVGTTTAQLIAEKNLADVVLVDIIEGIPQGKALDIQEACPLWNSSVQVTGTHTYDATADSDIVVITAGLARKPGMSRDDLLFANAEIIKGVARNISKTSPGAIIIVVSNPMDAMTQLTQKFTGFPHKKIIGMGGVLDSARMRTFISLELGVSPETVQTMVLGGHGDLMVPLSRFSRVNNKLLSEVLHQSRITEIIERTKNGGAEIVSLLKTGSAYYAPAAGVVVMIENIFGSNNEILPCSVYLNGEYGIQGVYLGVPVRLSPEGVAEIVEFELEEAEKEALLKSAESVRGLIKKLEEKE